MNFDVHFAIRKSVGINNFCASLSSQSAEEKTAEQRTKLPHGNSVKKTYIEYEKKVNVPDGQRNLLKYFAKRKRKRSRVEQVSVQRELTIW